MNTTTAASAQQPSVIYDLVTIGSGSAARAAANEARRLDKTVAMIEQGLAGGTCLNVGCVPSKTLLAAASARMSAAHGKFPGIATSAGPVDLSLLVRDKDQMIGHFRQSFHVQAPKDAGIAVFRGKATFVASDEPDIVALVVADSDGNTNLVYAKQVLIASGAAPFIPSIPGLSEVDFLTSGSAMSLEQVPESMLVVGGNAIGLEQGQLFARLGSKVEVVEIAPRIAPFEDPAISAALEQALSAEGIMFHTGANLTNVVPHESGVLATVVAEGRTQQIFAHKILIATGRRPATEGLNLDAVNVSRGDRGEIIVDEHLRTSNPRIWAAGDVTGMAQLVYVASAQGTVAASNALGNEPRSLDYTALPRVIFTSPEMAAVGMTPMQAEAAQIAYDVREIPVSFVLRAIVSRHDKGIIKMISERETGRILGIHMVGESAGEVIAAATYIISAGLTVDQVAKQWSPYFTMAESLKNVASSAPTLEDSANG